MKKILITGGNRGIGLEICRQLDKKGNLVIMGSRDLDKGLKAAKDFSNNFMVKALDVTDEEQVKSLAEELLQEIGHIDVLINNAGLGTSYFEDRGSGISSLGRKIKNQLPGISKISKPIAQVMRSAGAVRPGAKVSDMPLDQVRELMETNFYGPWLMIQCFIPLLKKSPGGRIINISSGLGQLESLDGKYPAYRISKSSLNAMTIMFAEELKKDHISVNAMCPGWVRTEMGGPEAPRSVGQGADTAVWLATEPDIPTGYFFRDRQQIPW
jgi:NAD(P)-dependent dehydrogenase (short-subunit alcohol dehydrogenase family)